MDAPAALAAFLRDKKITPSRPPHLNRASAGEEQNSDDDTRDAPDTRDRVLASQATGSR